MVILGIVAGIAIAFALTALVAALLD